MQGRRLPWIVIPSLAMLCACTPHPETVPTGQPAHTPGERWEIEFMQSGGFIGMSRSVRVTSDGELVAADKRSGSTVSRQLTPGQLDQLGKLYYQATSADQSQRSSGCADCFIYDLRLTSGATTTEIRLDDTNLPGSAAEPLITYLRQLRDSAFGSS